MADDITTLGLKVDHKDVKQARAELDLFTKAGENAAKSATSAEKSSASLGNSLGRLKGILAGLALGATAAEFVKTADNMSLMDARLKMVTGTVKDFKDAQLAIYAIAQKSNAEIGATTILYTKLHEPVKRLGGGVRETSAIVESFAASLRVGGASTQEAAAATLQFAQAMGSGKLQGDEFRSIAEASPRFMKALAEGMNVPIEKLKEMGSEGKLTADIVGNALVKSLGVLRSEMAQVPDTVGGALTRFGNDFKLLVNDLNKSSGLTTALSGSIEDARKLLPKIGAELTEVFSSARDWIDRNQESLASVRDTVGGVVKDLWEGVKALGSFLGGVTEILVQSGALGVVWETVRFGIAGLKDGIDIIGAALALTGSKILQFVVDPLISGGKIAAAIASVFSKDLADSMRQLISSVEGFSKGGEEYANEVAQRFMAGNTAVQTLNASLEKNKANAAQAKEALAGGIGGADAQREMSKFARQADGAGAALKTLKNSHTDLSKEQEKTANSYKGLSAGIRQHLTELNMEAAGGAKLNEAEKARIKYKSELLDKYKHFSVEQRETIDALFEEWDALIKTAEAAKLYGETLEAVAKHSANLQAEQYKNVDALRSTVAQMRDENDRLRLGEKAYRDREVAVLRATAADLEWQAANEGGNWALEEQARLLRERAQLAGDNVLLQEAQATAEEWRRTTDSIADGLIDAFERGIGKGKSLFVSLRDYVTGWISQLLKVQLQGAASSVLTGDNSRSALSQAQLAATLYNSGGTAGGVLGTAAAGGNYAAVYSGQAYGTAFGSQQSAMLAAQESGMVSQAGASSMSGWASSWGPYVAAIVASYLVSANAYKQGFTSSNVDSTFWESPASGELTNAAARLMDSLGIGSTRNNQIFSGAAGFNYLVGRGTPRVDAQGVQGTIGAGDFTGTGFADVVQKGGLFRSDKRWTETGVISDEIDRFFDSTSRSIYEKAKDFGAALGLPVAALADVTQSIKVTLGDDAAKNQEEITKALSGYGDALVKGYAEAVAPLAQYGETTYETISRVATALVGVNEVFDTLGIKALTTSVAGAEAAVALTDLFGGMDNLRSTASEYFNNFFTEGEKTAMITSNIAEAMAGLGMEMPKTRAEFRAMVEAQDPLTESGQKVIAAMLGMQGAFAEVVPAAKEADAALRSVADILSERLGLERQLLQLQGNTAELRRRELAALDPSNRAIQEQIWALEDSTLAMQNNAKAAADSAAAWARMSADVESGVRAAYQDVVNTISAAKQDVESAAQEQLDALQQKADGVTSAFEQIASALEGFIKDVKTQITGLEGTLAGDGGRALAEVAIQEALNEAKKGKGLDMDAIKGALGTFTKVDVNKFTNAVDYKREVARTANVLREVNGAADNELRQARRTMEAQLDSIKADMSVVASTRDAELAALDAQLAAATDAVSQLISIDKGVTGVQDAIENLNKAMGALAAVMGKPNGNTEQEKWTTVGNTDVWSSAGGATAMRNVGDTSGASMVVKGTNGLTGRGSDIVDWVRAKLAEGDQMAIYNRAKEVGISLASLDAMMGAPVGTSPGWARAMGLPVFAAGGMHAGGVRLVGEDGPELEATGPARYYSAADTVSMLTSPQANSEALAAAVRALQEEVSMLRQENKALLASVIKQDMKTADFLQRWDGDGMPPVRS